jgi:hypothetical protein
VAAAAAGAGSTDAKSMTAVASAVASAAKELVVRMSHFPCGWTWEVIDRGWIAHSGRSDAENALDRPE